MNQNASTMTTDNSGSRKQANHSRAHLYSRLGLHVAMCRGRAPRARGTGEGAGGERGRGHGWRVGRCVKGLSSLPGCMLLSLALSSPIKPATPQQYGAINYRHAAINAERRGEAGTYKQDKRPHKSPAAT